MEIKSFFSKLYLDLQQRIEETVPQVVTMEQDFGQDMLGEWRTSTSYPAALIDFTATNYEAESGISQFANVNISIRFLVDPLAQNSVVSTTEVNQSTLTCFETEHQLVAALHGWTPNEGYCQPIIRTSITSDNENNTGLRTRKLMFATAYEEDFE